MTQSDNIYFAVIKDTNESFFPIWMSFHLRQGPTFAKIKVFEKKLFIVSGCSLLVMVVNETGSF